jgi:NTP pyrophosphatase (non-canonical NTP hydrolase)
MNLTNISKRIHLANVEKGFYDDIENIPQDYLIIKQLALVLTEIAEAIEVLRKNGIDNTLNPHFPSALTIDESIAEYKKTYKDTFQAEMADTFIRLFDLCGYLNIDIDSWVDTVLEANKHRPYKHGKKY